MSEEISPERTRLVEELAQAINQQKHADTDAERAEAGIRMQEKLEEVRANKEDEGGTDDKGTKKKAS